MSRRRALLIGCEGDIGRAIAGVLSRAGHDLGLTWCRDEPEAMTTAEAVRAAGGTAVLARADLAQPEAAVDAVRDLVGRLGGLDAVVVNAGLNEPAEVLATEIRSLRRVLEVNVVGTTAVLLAAARTLVDAGRGGRIVVVTSVHEHLPLASSLAYTASKHALGGVVKSLAVELAPDAITVNAVAPGAIATAMTGRSGVDARTTSYPVPAGRLGSPEEVAAVIGFLASPEASYVTGSSYGVDGGLALLAPAPVPAGARRSRRSLRARTTRSRDT